MTQAGGFWRLTHPESATLAEWDDSVDVEQVLCPITKDHMRGGKRTTDLRVVLRSSRIDDFVWTWYGDCMIQDRVLRRFREAGFSGFEVAPVEVTKMRVRRAADQAEAIRQLPPLWEVIVTGWAGEAPAESGIRMRYYCEACKDTEYTNCKRPEYLIDPTQWDGSDFFIVWPLPKFIFVTDRVAQLIRSERWRGARLVRPENLRSLFADGTGFGPGEPPPGRKVRGPEAFPKVRIRRFRQPKARAGGVSRVSVCRCPAC